MALDKQRILSELGSVMNQLQSADCGCMGKLFSNSGQESGPHGNALPTCGGCRRGCCRGHGYGVSYPMNATGMGSGGMGGGCMSAGGMDAGGMGAGGMGAGGIGAGGMGGEGMGGGSMGRRGMGRGGMGMGAGGMGAGEMGAGGMDRGGMGQCMGRCNPKQAYAETYNFLSQNLMQPVVKEVYDDLSSITPANAVGNNPLANQMGLSPQRGVEGMGKPNAMQNFDGSNVMNSMPIDNSHQPATNLTDGMGSQIVNMMMGGGGKPITSPEAKVAQLNESMMINAPHSPHGQVGLIATPLTQGSAEGNMGMSNMNQGGMGAQLQNQDGSHPRPNVMAQENPMNANPAALQMKNGNNLHGQHSQGVKKFNEMFPGVMQGTDLGFDPMAIALQMNPKNQQKLAMDSMQKMMNGNKGLGNSKVPGVNMGASQQLQPNANNQVQQNQMNNQQSILEQPQKVMPGQHQILDCNTESVLQRNQQQIYTATGAPGVNQQIAQRTPTQQQYIDPNTGALITSPNLPTYGEMPGEVHTEIPAENALITPQQMFKEPIYPAEPSRNQTYTYNTLGQPIQMLPGNTYHTPDPGLPQTLSPQPIQGMTGRSAVKSTVSKTSLTGIRPAGGAPSRGQLRQIYQQYKGSQSYTQQNIKAPGYGATYSDGQLNGAQIHGTSPNQIPVEKVGGDTAANLQMTSNQLPDKVEQVMGQIGDVPATRKLPPASEKVAPVTNFRGRNGLQDMVYTSYPASTAWSFHGESAPPSPICRQRHRV